MRSSKSNRFALTRFSTGIVVSKMLAKQTWIRTTEARFRASDISEAYMLVLSTTRAEIASYAVEKLFVS